jgi:[protein-PII] uridylyltransferase
VISVIEQRNRDAAQQGTRRAGEVLAAVPGNQTLAPPRILWLDGASTGQLLIEIRATDRIGLLAVLTSVFEKAGVDIVWAKVSTLGSSVDDVFSVVVPGGNDEQVRAALQRDLLAVLPSPAPSAPAQGS